MDTTLPPVYVYGFEPAELENWQRDYGLRPIEVEPDGLSVLSEEKPVVVHARAAAELTRKFEAEGVPSDIILFLPPGASVPGGAYYEASVGEGELSGLASILEHPQQFRMYRLAQDVPLRLLARPIRSLNLQRLGLPEADAEHLKTCPTCPGILREALRQRVRLYQTLNCPSPTQLIQYAGLERASAGQLAAHISSCPFCKPQVQALRGAVAASAAPTQVAQPPAPRQITRPSGDDRGKVLIDMPVGAGGLGPTKLSPQPSREIEALRDRLRAAFGTLFDLFEGARRGIGGWEIAGARGLAAGESDVLPILQEVYDEQIPVILRRGTETLYLGWDPEERLPYLELPGVSAGRRKEFSLHLNSARTGDEVWSAKSDDGKLIVRPEIVERALRDYEAQHASPGEGPDAEYHMLVLEESAP